MHDNHKNMNFYIQEFSNLWKADAVDIIKSAIDFVGNQDMKEEDLLKKLEKSLIISKICINEINLEPSILIPCIIYFCCDPIKSNQKEIHSKFGGKISDILSGILKIPDIKLDKLNIQSENFIKLIITIVPDVNAILIKLASMLFEVRNLKKADAVRQYQIATVISSLYAPIAHRLGLYAIKTEMEDLSMKYLHTEIYQDIAKKLEDTKEKRNKFIEEFIAPLKKELSKHKISCEIKGRPKSIFSIWNKMKTQGVEFEEVYDQFAIRVIIDSRPENEKNDCWRVYSIITDLYKPNPLRLRDWISSPKSSGYESLHTTVIGPEEKWVEVQIRTIRMDEIAEKGQAAHWKYKEKKEGQESDWMSKIRTALEKPEQYADEEHDRNKAMLYTDEIFVFTPEGDLRKLHTGYTVLDFAFQIHSNIGETCTGAMVNDKFVSIKHILKNGDHVKILTAKTQKPRLEWLEIVKSERARNKIKRALKSLSYKDSDEGKDLLKHKLGQLKIAYNDLNVNKLMEYFGFKTSLDLYQSIGSGKIEIQKIKKAFVDIALGAEKPKEIAEQHHPEIAEFEKKITDKDYLIIENNLQTIDYHMAKCCNPIPGDAIFGFVTVSKGTKIHKKDCSNASDMVSRYPYRVIKASWNNEAEVSKFVAQIRVTGRDNIGVTNSITQILANEFKLNLKALTIHPRKENTFEGIIVTTVNDKKQLDELISRLKRIDDVLSVERVRK
jgi:GTP diphosphokinase / guanosine-3',5'-bis(diphosphate) 3'-diphosphatase